MRSFTFARCDLKNVCSLDLAACSDCSLRSFVTCAHWISVFSPDLEVFSFLDLGCGRLGPLSISFLGRGYLSPLSHRFSFRFSFFLS